MHFAVTTTLNIEGFRIVDYKGVVRGIIVRADDCTRNFRRPEEYYRRSDRRLYPNVRADAAASL